MTEPNTRWVIDGKRRIGSVRRHQYRTGGDCWLAVAGVGATRRPVGMYLTEREAEYAVRREWNLQLSAAAH